jgi:UPF0716 family protein affecting phage T7 exclusion
MLASYPAGAVIFSPHILIICPGFVSALFSLLYDS